MKAEALERAGQDEGDLLSAASSRSLPRFEPVGRGISLTPARPVEDSLFGSEEPAGGTTAVPGEAVPAPQLPARPVAAPAKPLRQLLFGRRDKAPEAPRAWQQPELRLDQVKVVRNDLNDTDFELVRPEPVEAVEALPPVVRSGWSRRMLAWLVAPLLGLGRKLG